MFFFKTNSRQRFVSRVKGEISRSAKDGKVFGLLIIRLLKLRELNQEYGHEFSDLVLDKLQQIIQEHVGHQDLVVRIGDKEFGVMQSNTRGSGDCILLANRIIDICEHPILINDMTLKIKVVIGVATFPENAQEAMGLLKCADYATYKAQNSHNGYAECPSDLDSDTTTMFTLENELDKAVNNNEIEYHYQPKVDIVSGKVSGFEVLSRWNSSKWGFVRPDIFIEAAERSNLITLLTIDCLTRTIKEYSEIQKKFDGRVLSLSVNLSAKILNNPEAIERVINTVNIWCDKPETLILEITEGAIISDPEASHETLRQLHDTGVNISIDDFGTGYSSLSYLKKLPVDELKIDKSFVLELLQDSDDQIIVQTIIDLASNFNLTTVAEGVENEEIYRQLGAMGCKTAQGYYLSRPMTYENMASWIGEWEQAPRRPQAL